MEEEDAQPEVEPAEVEVDETPAETEPAEQEASVEQEAPAAEPSIDDFDWDSWDGAIDALPESARPWAERVASRYEAAASAAQEEAERARMLYEAISEGLDDPRLKELQEKLEKGETEWSSKHQEFESKIREYEDRVAAFEAFYDQEAERLAKDFQDKNAWIFDDGPVQKLAEELLGDDGFSLEVLPDLLRQPKPVIAKARELMKEFGNPGLSAHAVKLAKLEQPQQETTPSEKLVSGAGPRNKAADVENAVAPDAGLADLRLDAIRRSMRLAH